MSGRRFACFLLGAWLASGLLLFVTISRSVGTIESAAENLAASEGQPEKTSPAEARRLLTRHARQQNRTYLEGWAVAQAFAGAALFLCLLFGTHEGRVGLSLSLVMLVMASMQFFVPVPETVSTPALRVLMTPYFALEMLKTAVGVALGARLILARSRSRNSRKGADEAATADQRHIAR